LNPAAASTPNNRENINYVTTGPDLTLPLGSSNQMLLEGRYANVNYEVTHFNSNRYSGGVGVRHELSSRSGLSVNLQHESVRYESVLNPDFDQDEAYVRWDAQGARTRLDLDVGYDRLKLQVGDQSGAMARLQLTRQLTTAQSIIFTAGHDYSDAGNEFLLLQALGGANLAAQAVGSSVSPFKQNYVTLHWGFEHLRTGFGVDVGHFKLTYLETNTLNEQRTTANAQVTRRLTPTLEGGLYGVYIKEQFPNLFGGDYNVYEGTAQLTYHVNSRVTVDLEFTHTRREAQVSSTGYSENRGWIKFKYGRALPPRSTAVVPALPKYPGQLRY
jgi:hypothetical protein